MRWRGRRTPKVEKLQRKGRVDRLREAARYSDRMIDSHGKVFDRGAPVRVAAITALKDHQPAEGEEWPDLVGLFTERLHDDHPAVVRAAAEALAGDASTQGAFALVDVLAGAGTDLPPDTRSSVLESLRSCACPGITERWCATVVEARDGDLDERDREELLALIEVDYVFNPRQRVFEVLTPWLHHSPGREAEERRAEKILSWCMPASLAGLDVLITGDDVSAGAVRLAGEAGDQELLDPLVHALEHPEPSIRAEAALALGALSDTAAVLPLMGASSDPDVGVRKAAIQSLDLLGSAGVTAALAVIAQTASNGGEPSEPMVGARPWGRTLNRLVERAGLGRRTRGRELRRSVDERMAELNEARGRYEALIAESEIAESDPPPPGA